MPLRGKRNPVAQLASESADVNLLANAGAGSSSLLAEDGGSLSDSRFEALELELEESRGNLDDGVATIWQAKNIGYLMQYWVVGLIYGGLPATIYGFFLGYLSVESYVYSTALQVVTLPWIFKFMLGMLNDCVPLWGGYRRKPYMVIGWAICCGALLLLAFTPLPQPYWCVDPGTGQYIIERTSTAGGAAAGAVCPAAPCHPDTPSEGGKFALLMCFAAFGYVIADVAADGLTVEYAKREPLARRGQTQSSVYFVRTLGSMAAYCLVGLCMNGKEYNGTFDWSLSFSQICMIFAVPAGIMAPISWYFVIERPLRADERDKMSFTAYRAGCWQLLQSKAMFYVVMYQFLSSALGTITTTAQGNVQKYWAGVKNLQNQLFSFVGLGLFALGIWLVKKYFLGSNWRVMLASTAVLLNVTDAFFVFFTVFDVVRNQYFYLGETVLAVVPEAMNFLVSTFVIVEMADTGNEGMVYGLLTTTHNLGMPFARAISNQLFGLFSPSLSDADNYIVDEASFRSTVGRSFILQYALTTLSLALLPLMPTQKRMAQSRKRSWPAREQYGQITVALLTVAFIYSIVIDLLAMFPSTACLGVVGGDGCDKPPENNTVCR